MRLRRRIERIAFFWKNKKFKKHDYVVAADGHEGIVVEETEEGRYLVAVILGHRLNGEEVNLVTERQEYGEEELAKKPNDAVAKYFI
jgi:hypothetical protein